jgi:hypothetical protein
MTDGKTNKILGASGRQRELIPEIVVTPEMVNAGIEELREHTIGEDWNYVLECVFRAMAYENLDASSKTERR